MGGMSVRGLGTFLARAKRIALSPESRPEPLGPLPSQTRPGLGLAPISSCEYYKGILLGSRETADPSPSTTLTSTAFSASDLLSVPVPGSVVEAQVAGRVCFGVVTKGPTGWFQEEHTSLEVLTALGEFLHVCPQDVTFHLPAYLSPLPPDMRSTPTMATLRHHLRELVRSAQSVRRSHYHTLLRPLYLRVAHEEALSTFTLSDITPFLSLRGHLFEALSSLAKATALLACHLEFSSTPVDWMVMANQSTSIRRQSPLVPETTYAAVSLRSRSQLRSVMLGTIDVLTFRWTLRGFKSIDTLGTPGRTLPLVAGHFLYDRPSDQAVLHLLKHYAVYPHPRMKTKVAEIVGDACEPTAKGVYALLRQKAIYSASTDPYLSAGWYGKGQELQAPDFSALEDTSGVGDALHQCSRVDPMHFVRTELSLSTVYAITSSLSSSRAEWAFSVEGDAETVTINFHLPDPATKLPASSPLFQCLQSRLPPFCEKTAEYRDTAAEGFPEALLPLVGFSGSATMASCMTVSMTYKPQSEAPWDTVHTTVGFNYLLQIKMLTRAELGSVLEGQKKRHPAKFSSPVDYSLSWEDEQRLGMVRNAVMHHQTHRRRRFALEKGFTAPIINETSSGGLELVFAGVSMVELFMKEVEVLLGGLVGRFGVQHELPLVYRSLEILDPPPEGTMGPGIEISPRSFLYPTYHATAYEHFFLEPGLGPLTPTLYFCAANLLMPEVVDYAPRSGRVHTALGLESPFVRVGGVLRELESLLNQYQLLAHCIKEAYLHGEVKQRVVHMRGYDLNPWSPETLRSLNRAPCGTRGARDAVASRVHTYWALRYLEQEHQKQQALDLSQTTVDDPYRFLFKCVILHSLSSPTAKAYCMELGVEVEVVIPEGDTVTMGDRILCSRVLALDPLTGSLLLQ